VPVRLLKLLRRSVWLGAALSLCASIAAAQDGSLKVYPVAGLFGVDSSSCSKSKAIASVKIATALCGQLSSPDQRAAWGRQFDSLMRARFGPNIRDRLDAELPAGVTREAMLSQTLVASLHLSRAELWTVPKQSVIEVHLPITVSLLMTNILTGEVVFVENLSTVIQGPMPIAGYEARAAAEFPQRLNQSIATLVENAALRFRPNAIKGTVRARAGQLYVFDIGRRGGLREGDQIGPDATVLFADADYSIVEPALGGLSVGQPLSRQIAQPVESLARPSILVVVAGAPDGVAPAYISTLMEDALGGAEGFTVLPVNPSLPQIREPALAAAGVSGRLRSLPNYFLRLSVAALDPLEADTNVAGVRRRVQEARAFVEVINQDGRVVFASQGVDRRIDEITKGMAPATEQRRDAAMRNAILDAASKLSTSFKPTRLRLAARPAGEEVRIADPGGVLSPGVDALVVRRIGRLTGIEGDVWSPLAQVEVASIEGTEAVARYAGLETARVQRGDQVAYEVAGPGSKSRRTFSQCLKDGRPSLSVRGTVTQPLFEQIAVNSFAAGFAGAVQIAGFDREVRAMGLQAQFDDFDELGLLDPSPSAICFEPVHQVALNSERLDRDRFIIGTYDLTIGYVLKQDNARVAGGGLQQTLSATAVPAAGSARYRDQSLQMDLADEVTKLARRAARELTPPL
jgi:hypothetical protein